MTLIPTVLWAQRKDKLFLTIDLQDCKDPEVKLDNEGDVGTIFFRGKAGKDDAEYGLDLSFMAGIDPEASKINVNPRNIVLVIAKKESGDHWLRLLKGKGREPHINVDWAKYIDQEEEEAGQDTFDFHSLPGNFAGLDDMGEDAIAGGAEEDDDSDDEELSDLKS